jgi:hypothetical protein
MVFMPPRSGKSQLISQFFPAWYLGWHPDNRVILTSYEADFAATWGWKARSVFEEFAPDIFGLSVRGDSSARNRWDIVEHVGGMNTAGVGGAITGKGADLFIIDDPVKNAEDANSQLKRDKAWDWYQSTAYTRLEPDASMILIMTRWHPEDLGGLLLKEMEAGGEQWDVLKFPAIAEENDLMGRKIGEPLWKERYPIELLNTIQGTVSAYWWAAMYQQSPYARTGKTFKRADFIIADGLDQGHYQGSGGCRRGRTHHRTGGIDGRQRNPHLHGARGWRIRQITYLILCAHCPERVLIRGHTEYGIETTPCAATCGSGGKRQRAHDSSRMEQRIPR